MEDFWNGYQGRATNAMGTCFFEKFKKGIKDCNHIYFDQMLSVALLKDSLQFEI